MNVKEIIQTIIAKSGMKHLDEWLKPIIPDTDIVFVDAGEPFTYIR